MWEAVFFWGGGLSGCLSGQINLRPLPSQYLSRKKCISEVKQQKSKCNIRAAEAPTVKEQPRKMLINMKQPHAFTQAHPGVSAVSQIYYQLRPFVQFCLIGSPAACSISTLQSLPAKSIGAI